MRVSGASADAPRREKNNDRSVPGCRIHPRRRLLQVYISPSFDFFLPSNFCCLFASFSLHGVWSVCPRKCRSRDFCNSLGAIGTNAEGEGLGTAEVACWVEGESGMEEGRGEGCVGLAWRRYGWMWGGAEEACMHAHGSASARPATHRE